jgi:hypothetical protein
MLVSFEKLVPLPGPVLNGLCPQLTDTLTKLIHSYNLPLLSGLRKLKLERNYNVFNFKIHAVQISYLSIFI